MQKRRKKKNKEENYDRFYRTAACDGSIFTLRRI